MAESRSSGNGGRGSGKKAKAKAKSKAASATSSPAVSEPTRSVVSGKKPTKKAVVAAPATAVAPASATTESPATRKKKKRKRIHKRKGDAAGVTPPSTEQRDESPEPPTKKKKQVAAKPAPASAPVTPMQPATSKNTRSRNKKRRGSAVDVEGMAAETENRRVQSAEPSDEQQPRGRLPSLSAAASAGASSVTAATLRPQSTPESSPASSKAKSRKRKRNKQRRGSSVEPVTEEKKEEDHVEAPAAMAPLEEKRAAPIVECQEKAPLAARPKSKIISLVKVKATRIVATKPSKSSPMASPIRRAAGNNLQHLAPSAVQPVEAISQPIESTQATEAEDAKDVKQEGEQDFGSDTVENVDTDASDDVALPGVKPVHSRASLEIDDSEAPDEASHESENFSETEDEDAYAVHNHGHESDSEEDLRASPTVEGDLFMSPTAEPNADHAEFDDEDDEEGTEEDKEEREDMADSESEDERAVAAQDAEYSYSDEESEQSETGYLDGFPGSFPCTAPTARGSPDIIVLSDSDTDSDEAAKSDTQETFAGEENVEGFDLETEEEEDLEEDEEDQYPQERRYVLDDISAVDADRAAADERKTEDISSVETEAEWMQDEADSDGGVKTEDETEDDEHDRTEEEESSEQRASEVHDREENHELDEEEKEEHDEGTTQHSRLAESVSATPQSATHSREEKSHSPIAVVKLSIPAVAKPQSPPGVTSTHFALPAQSVCGGATASVSVEQRVSSTSTPAKSSVMAYTTTPSKQLLESVLSLSPRATVASITAGLLPNEVPQRNQSVNQVWGPSFGMSEPTTAVPRPHHAEASPLSSWFFSKGPANFKRRVVMPRDTESSLYGAIPGSPRQRIGSPRPVKKPRLDEEVAQADEPINQVDKFVQGLLDKSSWRSWYTASEPDQLLDPPLPAAMVKRLGGEAVVALFNRSVSELDAEDSAGVMVSTTTGKRKPALARLEDAIKVEKVRARAFDQELLLLLQGKTLSGKELSDEFAPLLMAPTSK